MVQILPYVEETALQSISKNYGKGDEQLDLQVRGARRLACISVHRVARGPLCSTVVELKIAPRVVALNDYASATPANVLDPTKPKP